MSTQRRFPHLRRMGIWFGALILGFIAVVLFWSPTSPEFDGRPLSVWVRELSSPDRAASTSAHEFFKRSGDRTVDDLIDMIQKSKSESAEWRPQGFVYRFLPVGVIQRIAAAKFERANAVYACSVIGAPAHRAVPTVLSLRADQNQNVRSRVARALGEIRSAPSESVPALTNLLADPDATVRNNAVRSLGLYGAAATGALSALTNALSDPDQMVRGVARFALVMIKTPEKIEKVGDDQFRITE